MKKIAIIDDVALNAKLIQAIVRRIDDVEATVFTDPVAALQWCRQNAPDLILLDYQMPEMDGIEFIRKFREHDPHVGIPIVLVTGEGGKEIFREGLGAGATDFLRKPVDDVELLARARNMLRLREHQLELAAAYEMLKN